MFTWLHRLIGCCASSRPAAVPQILPITECAFTIDGLKTDYETRTWQFEHYKPMLVGSNDRLLHWIGSMDRSGYVRERCTRWLIANYVPDDENRILLRLEDWVPQVQRLAQEWALKHFPELPFASIQANAGLLQHLLRKDKLLDDPALAIINASLLQKARDSKGAEFLTLPSRFRRYLYLRSLAHDQALRGRILADPDPFNRLTLLTNTPPLTLTPDELIALKKDASALVRRRLFRWRIESGVAPNREEMLVSICDPNRMFREMARYWASELYGIDAYAVYRSRTGRERFYVADFAKCDDMETFREGIGQPDNKLKVLCLRALCEADCSALARLDISHLITANRWTRQLTCRYLPKVMDLGEIKNLRPLFNGASAPSLMTYLGLLLKKSYWGFIDVALTELASNPLPELVTYVRETILDRTAIYESPTPELRRRIGLSLAKCRHLGVKGFDDAVSMVEFTLKTS